jgi:sugar phosphate isomerase/epimerase
LGIENHDRFSAAELRAIIQAIDSPQVGICLDTANSIGAGEDLSTVLTALADYTVNLHIKDFAIERLPYLMGFTVEGRPAGSGRLDVAALWRRMAQVPRCRSAIIELWTPPILDASGAVDMEATVAKEAIWARISLQHVRAAAQADRP